MNDSAKQMGLDKSPHLSQQEKRELLKQLDNANDRERYEIMTQLAWRPAWAIRSRRGAWSAVKQLFR